MAKANFQTREQKMEGLRTLNRALAHLYGQALALGLKSDSTHPMAVACGILSEARSQVRRSLGLSPKGF